MPRLIILILLILASWQVSAEVRKYYVSKSVALHSIGSEDGTICKKIDVSIQDDLLTEMNEVQDDIAQDNSLILFSRVSAHFTNYFMMRVRQLHQLGIDSYTSQLLHRPPII